MARVLIVEDEAVLRSSMARGIAKLSGVDTVEAGTVDEAVVAIDRAAPDLIVSDLDLPERTGIELIGEIGKRGLRVPIIFISAYLRAYGTQIPPNANVEVREKPIALDELRNLVRDHLVNGPGLAPSSGPSLRATVNDFVAVATRGGHSITIEIERDGKPIGRIAISSGELWSAQDGDGSGTAAVERLLASDQARAHCQMLRSDPGERNLFEPWPELVAAHDDTSVEEVPAASSATTAPRAEIAPPPAAVESRRSELSEEDDALTEHLQRGRAAFQRADYAAALADFEAAKALSPTDPKIDHHVALARRLSDNSSDVTSRELRSADPPTTDGTRRRAAEAAPRGSFVNNAFEEARDRALDALLERRHADALREFLAADALQPGDSTVTANIHRLRQMGAAEPE